MPNPSGDVKVTVMNTKQFFAGLAVGAAVMAGSGCGDEEVSTIAVAQAEPARAEAAPAPAPPSPATAPSSPSTAAGPGEPGGPGEGSARWRAGGRPAPV